MTLDVAREREIRPGTWVKAVLDVAKLDEEHVAVRVKKRTATIYRWQAKGIEFLDFLGLLGVTGLLSEPEDQLRRRLLDAGMKAGEVDLLLEERAAAMGRRAS